MQQMLQEAREGRFATKGDAVKRRDQLVGEAAPQAVPADESAPTEPAAPAEESAPADSELWQDGPGQLLENSQDAQDVD